MDTIPLGKTGLMVSQVGFGGIPISRLSFADAVSVARYCFDHGITFFDTANAYGDGEDKLGSALEWVRDQVTFATKTFAEDAETAARHIEQSLVKLKTSKIDLYQIHNVRNEQALQKVLGSGGTYEALDKARAKGKIHSIGISSHNIPTAIEACNKDLFDTIQIPFNFVEHEPAEELFSIAMKKNIGIIAMKPLGGGLLDRSDLCFRFLQQYPYVVPIPGIKATEEVDEIIGLYRSKKPLTQTEWDEIKKIRSELGTKFCHRCEYCMPCEKGVQIFGILRFNSVVKRFPPSAVIDLVEADMKSLENCDQCGECTTKCPYDLPIPDLLKENLSRFKQFIKEL